MKKRTLTQVGTINDNGKLSMYMGEANDFFSQWKGERVAVTFKVIGKKSSDALRGYYFACVVPTFQQALYETGERKTQEQTEKYMRSLSPIMYDENVDPITGKYSPRLKEVREVSNAELIEHINCIKQICAEEYSVYINDPNEF